MSFDKFSRKELVIFIEILLERVDALENRVASLNNEVESLKEENRVLKIKKNSSNSSKPPSTDLTRANQSLRQKSGLKKGGQNGHQGHTLEISSNPDKVILHRPTFCSSCGFNLEDFPETVLERRQVIDLPVIAPITKEHRICRVTCRCGAVCKSTFPANVKASAQYGENIEALTAYFSARQYMPYGRMQECFSDVFGVKISQSGLVNLIGRFAEKSLPLYQNIKESISKAEVVGSDETGAKVNGQKGWFFTWQNTAKTLISFSFSRGFDTIKSVFPAGFTKSVVVSDCLAAQLKVDSKAHQVCLAHLMRELNFFIESNTGKWAVEFKQLLSEAIALKKEIADYQLPNSKRQEIELRLSKLLEEQLSENKKLAAFQKRIHKHRQKLLPFLYYPNVPPDNNGSERAIRNVKVKQKISGHFGSAEAAQQFAVIRSVIDTVLKNNLNILQAMKIVAKANLT